MNDPHPDTKLEIPDRAELERRYPTCRKAPPFTAGI